MTGLENNGRLFDSISFYSEIIHKMICMGVFIEQQQQQKPLQSLLLYTAVMMPYQQTTGSNWLQTNKKFCSDSY